MQRLILHHFYRASIRKGYAHVIHVQAGGKNDAKLTDVCIRKRGTGYILRRYGRALCLEQRRAV